MARERKFSLEELFKTTKELLILHGYRGFTFSLLAEKLQVSRGTIYKYYKNKDELIIDYMIDDLNQFLREMKAIEQYEEFEKQFDSLLNLILERTGISEMIFVYAQVSNHASKKLKKHQETLFALHEEMYGYLHRFVELGKKEKKLKPHLPDGLIIGFILQSAAIPNRYDVPRTEWIQSMKETMKDGMYLR